MTEQLTMFKHRRRACQTSRGWEKLLVDSFAGGGGASLGIEMALGRAVDISVNHDPSAVEMHGINHPASRHACENVWKVDPKKITRGRPVGLAWFSPDCRHFSRAKGGKPVSPRVRGLAWIVVKWAKLVSPEIIVLENVREFEDWGPLIHVKGTLGEKLYDADGRPVMLPDRDRKGMTFRRWVSQLRGLGYVVEWRVLNAADYGAPTHRRRLFLIARRDGNPIVWPKATHGPGRRKPYRTAAECIDFSDLGRSIFDRKKPLAEKTLRRIVKGLERYVLNNPRPFILQVQNGSSGNGVRDSSDPLNTITAKPKGGGMALVTPHLSQFFGGMVGKEVTDPVPAVTAIDHNAIVAPILTQFRGSNQGNGGDEPVPTITSGAGAERPAGAAHALGVVAPYLVQRNGEREGQQPRSQQIDRPINTVTPNNNSGTLIAPWLTCYYGSDKEVGSAIDQPSRTVTVKDRVAMVSALLRRFGVDCGDVPTVIINGDQYVIADIFMRMLHPRELARAQGFPDDYVLTGSKANQVAKIGNSVCPPVAAAIVKANCKHLKAGAA
jgi:DNA (cytosine-5)-methyltransferase 1